MVFRTLLLGLLLGGLGGGATSGSTRGGSTTTTARGDGGEFGRALSDELRTYMLAFFVVVTTKTRVRSYLVDVLALQLSEEGLETAGVGLNADGLEDSGDVLGRGRGVASELEEEVGSEVLHFECSAR